MFENEDYQLPDGSGRWVGCVRYLAWFNELCVPLCELGLVRTSYGPGSVLFAYGDKSVDLPVWLIMLVNQALAKR